MQNGAKEKIQTWITMMLNSNRMHRHLLNALVTISLSHVLFSSPPSLTL